jgi:hypothetical protein
MRAYAVQTGALPASSSPCCYPSDDFLIGKGPQCLQYGRPFSAFGALPPHLGQRAPLFGMYRSRGGYLGSRGFVAGAEPSKDGCALASAPRSRRGG